MAQYGDAAVGQSSVLSPEDFYSPAMLAQAESQAVSDQIHNTVHEDHIGGFPGTAVAPGALDLHWKGDIPEEIAAIVESSPVEVRIHEASFSRDEAHAAIRDLFENPPASIPGEITRAGVSRDFRGVSVFVWPELPPGRASLQLPLSYSGIPLRFSSEPPPTFAVARQSGSRQNDLPPFSAGSRINRNGGTSSSICTSGFSVTDSSGEDGILTANHCGIGIFQTPTGIFVGNSAAGSAGVDTQFLHGGPSYGTERMLGTMTPAVSSP